VLVLGATGVTGSIAGATREVDLRRRNAVVVAGRNTERLDWLQTVGADDAIAIGKRRPGRQRRRHACEQPFDAVLDYLWAEPAETVLAALASSHPSAHFHATRFIQIGSMAV